MDSKVSKDRLRKICFTKLKTSFIGAISAVEDELGYLWGSGKEQHELTENEKKFDKLWQRLRSRILYNGNNQIRNLESEFDKYSINMYNYSYQMPVKKRGNS